MALSALGLATDLGAHLASDASLAHVDVLHAHADENQKCPFLLYRVVKLDHRDGHGLGTHTVVGQTTEATFLVSTIDEAEDPKDLAVLADAVDDAVRSWAPAGWGVLETTLLSERTDSHESEGRTYQAFIQTFVLIMERA